MSNQGLFNQLFRRKQNAPQRRSTEDAIDELSNGINVVLQAWRSNRGASGSVTAQSSLQVSAVWACINLISHTVASLPLMIYEDINGDKQRAKDHNLYDLLHVQPNPLMTALELREVLQSHLCSHGNAYCQLIYDTKGRVEEIWPLRPDRMLGIKIVNGQKIFTFQKENGETNNYSDATIWHTPGLGFDGIMGYSPIYMAKKSIGLAIDAEEFGSKFFANDARPGIVVEHPAQLSDPAYKRLKDDLDEEHTGIENSHRPMILEEGMKLHEVGIPPEDAQFLETRKFQVTEIARIFGVPPHLIFDLEKATFSNIEQQSIEFVVYFVRHWLVRWEQSINARLLLPSERKRFYAEHLVDGLLRGDTVSRYQAYGFGKQWGFLSTNDIRRLENMNPVEGGDVYLAPLNYTDQKLIDQVMAKQNLQTNNLPEGDESSAINAQAEIEARVNESVNMQFDFTMARVIKREVQDLKVLAKKQLTGAALRTAIENFYAGHCEWIKREIHPVFASAVILLDRRHLSPDLYCKKFSEIYSERGVNHVFEVLNQAETRGEDPLKALDNDLDNWKESRVSIQVCNNDSFLKIY